MHYAFLSVLLAISIMDLVFHRGLSVAPMALLYVVLKIQADRAADLLFKQGLSRPVSELEEPSWMPSPENDPFGSPAKEAREPLQLVGPQAEKKAGKKPKAEAKASPFRAPKFHGAPHEVLGIEIDANTGMIVKAFRHWIKEFHPDHIKPGQELRRATDRARSITSAKESLLDRRRQMRKAA